MLQLWFTAKPPDTTCSPAHKQNQISWGSFLLISVCVCLPEHHLKPEKMWSRTRCGFHSSCQRIWSVFQRNVLILGWSQLNLLSVWKFLESSVSPSCKCVFIFGWMSSVNCSRSVHHVGSPVYLLTVLRLSNVHFQSINVYEEPPGTKQTDVIKTKLIKTPR